MSGGPIDIVGVFDHVESVEHAYKVKIGIGSSFRCHFGRKPIFWLFWGFSGFLSRLLWAIQSPYLGPYLRFWL